MIDMAYQILYDNHQQLRPQMQQRQQLTTCVQVVNENIAPSANGGGGRYIRKRVNSNAAAKDKPDTLTMVVSSDSASNIKNSQQHLAANNKNNAIQTKPKFRRLS